ncbi:hypothetical protein PGTUg99_036842 [Puccinia graminis f. sp. tritici]|uniref:SAM domain-containing protein n=1 Tax=Puccinia graminis f. sp. tritici TaxID=56615 RepID=A0A5B0SEV6_PUCGR|nr:hypothetical protein PGTUg99_036842 [Puccinia graminis f. sp. tritici]
MLTQLIRSSKWSEVSPTGIILFLALLAGILVHRCSQVPDLVRAPSTHSPPTSITLCGLSVYSYVSSSRTSDYMALYEFSPSLPPYLSSNDNNATSGPLASFIDKDSTLTSDNMRVLGQVPPVIFECSINFSLYLSERTRRNSVNWVPVKPISDLSVTFNTNDNITLNHFQEIIAKKCNDDYDNIGRMIHEGTHCSSPTITWSAYILKNRKYPKSTPLRLFDPTSFSQWIDEIKLTKQTKGGVFVRMENPKDKLARARKEDLVAKTMKRFDARHEGASRGKGRRGPVVAGASSDEVYVHVDKIYSKYGMNTEYDRIHPVYLDPTNADRYILLTAGNVDKWAKDLCMRVAGVSLVSPPASIKYLTRKAPKTQLGPTDNATTNTLLELSRWLVNQNQAVHPVNQRTSPPSLVIGEDAADTMADYLEFISIAPHKRDDILTTLLQNDIDRYKMFRLLSIEDLKGLGFNIGVIAKLRSNVTRFRSHLAQQE